MSENDTLLQVRNVVVVVVTIYSILHDTVLTHLCPIQNITSLCPEIGLAEGVCQILEHGLWMYS